MAASTAARVAVLVVALVFISADYTPKPLDLTKLVGKRVMLVSAHPDDIEAAAGGTVKMLTQQGSHVRFVIATNGDKGCSNPECVDWSSNEIAVARAKEAVAAAAVLGVNASDVVILGYEDSDLTSVPEREVRERVVFQIRNFQPDVIMTWYGQPRFEMMPSLGWFDLGYHMDHQDIGRITLAAHGCSHVGRIFPDAGAPWQAAEFYMWQFQYPVLYTNISTSVDAKGAAFGQHKTQNPSEAQAAALMLGLAEKVAEGTGVEGLQYAEGFQPFF